MQIYGLTGGIGSGKSEVAARLAERGIPVIDADLVGHEVLEPGGPAADPVTAAFGEGVLTEGRIDREKLAAVVFDDEEARNKLNAIVHPFIGMIIAERCAEFVQEGRSAIVVEATLLAEDGRREPWLDGLILVLSREDVRLARLDAKREMDPADARKRMAAQTPPEQKASLAGYVIENNGTLEELRVAADKVAEAISSQAT